MIPLRAAWFPLCWVLAVIIIWVAFALSLGIPDGFLRTMLAWASLLGLPILAVAVLELIYQKEYG